MFDITQQGGIAVLRMAHGKANAMDLEFCQSMGERLEEIKKSSSKALVLTGEGNIFSAGLDLVRVLEEGCDYLRKLAPALSEVFGKLFLFPKPVVAAVNGHAIAGGCLLACTADHRIMSRGGGRIGVPELLVGVPFPSSAMEIMRFVTNSQQLQKLLYEGTTCVAEEAICMGLIDETVEPADLLDKSVEKAEKLASLSPQVFEHTKWHIRQPTLELIRNGESKFEPSVLDIWGAAETIEAMRSYVSTTLKK